MESPESSDMQAQIEALLRRVEANRSGIHALEGRADTAEARADAAEGRSVIDRDLIAELHAQGVLNQEHAGWLEEALRSSRTIAAAIGTLMESRGVGQDEAYALLKSASQHSNRKLRDLAADLVQSPTPGNTVSMN